MAEFKPVKIEKTIISIRLSADLLSAIDGIAGETDISRNELVIQCIEFALANSPQKKDKSNL